VLKLQQELRQHTKVTFSITKLIASQDSANGQSVIAGINSATRTTFEILDNVDAEIKAQTLTGASLDIYAKELDELLIQNVLSPIMDLLTTGEEEVVYEFFFILDAGFYRITTLFLEIKNILAQRW